MIASTFDLETNGVTLGGWSWRPDSPARAVVVIAHGMAEHSERYAYMASRLVDAGFAVMAADHRGHKRTAQTPEKAGHVADRDGWRALRDDLASVVNHARYTNPGLPIVLLGHSMGSLAVRDLVASNPGTVDLLVATGVIGDPGPIGVAGSALARAERRLFGPKRRSALLDRLTFGNYNAAFKPSRTSFDWLSRDESSVDAYIADEWCGFVCTTSFYAMVFEAAQRVNSKGIAARTPKNLPVLVMAGSADPAGNNGKAPRAIERLYRDAGLHDVTVTVYDDARHEVFNEVNRDEAIGDVIAWIDAHLVGIPR